MTEQEAIQATRIHFARIAEQCIEDVRSGKVKVNDPARYVRENEDDMFRTMNAEFDNTFTHRQHAHYLMTGECVGLLPAY